MEESRARQQICIQNLILNKGCKEGEKQKSRLAASSISLLMFYSLMMSSCRDVSGVPTLTPSDVAYGNGTTFSLRCSTGTTDDLWWYRLGPRASSEDHIVGGCAVSARFDDFYKVQCENQESTLTIVAVQFTAATYACVETLTTERATAHVTVLEAERFCLRNVTGEILNLTCVVGFTGQPNPTVKWIQLSSQGVKEITDGIVNSQRAGHPAVLTSSLFIQMNEINRFQVYSYNFTVNFCLPADAIQPTYGRLCVFSQEAWRAEDAEGTSIRIEEVTGATTGICTEVASFTPTCDSCNVVLLITTVITVVATAVVTSFCFLVFRKYSPNCKKRAREQQEQQNMNEEEGWIQISSG